jgi:hypothetical protein
MRKLLLLVALAFPLLAQDTTAIDKAVNELIAKSGAPIAATE